MIKTKCPFSLEYCNSIMGAKNIGPCELFYFISFGFWLRPSKGLLMHMVWNWQLNDVVRLEIIQCFKSRIEPAGSTNLSTWFNSDYHVFLLNIVKWELDWVELWLNRDWFINFHFFAFLIFNILILFNFFICWIYLTD